MILRRIEGNQVRTVYDWRRSLETVVVKHESVFRAALEHQQRLELRHNSDNTPSSLHVWQRAVLASIACRRCRLCDDDEI